VLLYHLKTKPEELVPPFIDHIGLFPEHGLHPTTKLTANTMLSSVLRSLRGSNLEVFKVCRPTTHPHLTHNHN
jgi:hypothetical protein